MQHEMIGRVEPTGEIELGIEDLETLEAPSYLTGLLGVAVGLAIGGAIVFFT